MAIEMAGTLNEWHHYNAVMKKKRKVYFNAKLLKIHKKYIENDNFEY